MSEASKIRLPCKWMRPLNDMWVGCWNKQKVREITGDQNVGILQITDRKYCRGEVDDCPDCWDGLLQKCIDQCKHYHKGTSKFNKLKGFCIKQCFKFELFEPNEEFELLYRDFDELDILDIIKLSKIQKRSEKNEGY